MIPISRPVFYRPDPPPARLADPFSFWRGFFYALVIEAVMIAAGIVIAYWWVTAA